jgi:hypothetical protein
MAVAPQTLARLIIVTAPNATGRFTGCDIVQRTIFRKTYYMRLAGLVHKIKEFVMKITLGAAVALMTAGMLSPLPVRAATQLFATEPAATQACGADEVVWIDLDHGRFYHKAQSAYAKGGNGGYACMKMAHAQYRESHD